MPCVIDTSAIIAVLLSEPERAALIRATKGAELVAPASVHWEIGNALSAALKRRRLTLAQAQQALTAYAAIAIRFVDVSRKVAYHRTFTYHRAYNSPPFQDLPRQALASKRGIVEFDRMRTGRNADRAEDWWTEAQIRDVERRGSAIDRNAPPWIELL